jgi:hypothetical protein
MPHTFLGMYICTYVVIVIHYPAFFAFTNLAHTLTPLWIDCSASLFNEKGCQVPIQRSYVHIQTLDCVAESSIANSILL